jgi:hypothetical protein
MIMSPKIGPTVNLGHLLTIIAMLASAMVFFSRFESRLCVVENNVKWLVEVTAKEYRIIPPTAAK